MKRYLYGFILLALCVAVFADAQEPCGSEIKLLLPVTELHASLKALSAGNETLGEVDLYDTDSLDLFSQGVIVRIRRGGTNDLMVKVQMPADKTIRVQHSSQDQFKCEFDTNADSAVRSYSILTKFDGPLPTSGSEIFALFSPSQKLLLQQAPKPIDWSHVKRVANIDSTTWQIRDQPTFSKLSLELWEWPANKVLELSTKTTGDGPSALKQLEQLVAGKGLALSKTQKLKTALVLEDARNSKRP